MKDQIQDMIGSRNLAKVMPFLWLGLSALWAVALFITDAQAWILALWVATTLAPLGALEARLTTGKSSGPFTRKERPMTRKERL